MITEKQIEKYDIPTRPVKTKPSAGKKIVDTRTAGFRERRGDKATELDAFLAVDDEEFTKVVQQAVDDHWRQDIYDELEEEYGAEADPPPKLNNKQLTEAREKMYQQINKAFYEGWDDYLNQLYLWLSLY